MKKISLADWLIGGTIGGAINGALFLPHDAIFDYNVAAINAFIGSISGIIIITTVVFIGWLIRLIHLKIKGILFFFISLPIILLTIITIFLMFVYTLYIMFEWQHVINYSLF